MNGTTLLVLGVLSICPCNILGPVVFFLANNALKTGTLPADEVSKVNIAKILGIVGSVLLLLNILNLIRNGGKVSYQIGNPRPAMVVTLPIER